MLPDGSKFELDEDTKSLTKLMFSSEKQHVRMSLIDVGKNWTWAYARAFVPKDELILY